MKLRVHLGLKIPNTEDKNNSYLRVTDHFRHWQDGKMIIFDDSFYHEKWHYHYRNESRLVIFFDIPHPDFSPENYNWKPIRYDSYGNLVCIPS